LTAKPTEASLDNPKNLLPIIFSSRYGDGTAIDNFSPCRNISFPNRKAVLPEKQVLEYAVLTTLQLYPLIV